jgi:glycosyltransferase involved in cell wall biosynthesis
MHIGLIVLAAGRLAGGPETYEVELARALALADPNTTYRVYCTQPEAARTIGVQSANMTFHVLRPRCRWINLLVSLPLALARDRIDLFHATYSPPPLSLRPYVFTHHDNSPFDHPEYYNRFKLARLRPLIRMGLARACRIICPSEFTRRRTVERFGIAPERISVVPLGVAARYRPVDPATARRLLSERYGVDAPYFFFAGKLQRSKNITRLLEAYACVNARLPGKLRLVLAGKRTEANLNLDEKIERLGGGNVRELGHIREEDLPALYSAATAFVFPSLSEGFGLPVIEAMACGTPVVTSNICSLPEVAGGDALLVDPCSVESIASAMLKLATDDALAASLSVRGQERAARFTWAETARRTAEIYRQARLPPQTSTKS